MQDWLSSLWIVDDVVFWCSMSINGDGLWTETDEECAHTDARLGRFSVKSATPDSKTWKLKIRWFLGNASLTDCYCMLQDHSALLLESETNSRNH